MQAVRPFRAGAQQQLLACLAAGQHPMHPRRICLEARHPPRKPVKLQRRQQQQQLRVLRLINRDKPRRRTEQRPSPAERRRALVPPLRPTTEPVAVRPRASETDRTTRTRTCTGQPRVRNTKTARSAQLRHRSQSCPTVSCSCWMEPVTHSSKGRLQTLLLSGIRSMSLGM